MQRLSLFFNACNFLNVSAFSTCLSIWYFDRSITTISIVWDSCAVFDCHLEQNNCSYISVRLEHIPIDRAAEYNIVIVTNFQQNLSFQIVVLTATISLDHQLFVTLICFDFWLICWTSRWSIWIPFFINSHSWLSQGKW